MDKADNEQESVSSFEKFRLLMWKNFLLQYRHIIGTIIQIVIPILFTASLIMMRSLAKPIIYRNNTIFNPFAVDSIALRDATHNIHVKEWKLVYYPRNDVFESLLSEVAASLQLDGVEGVNKQHDVETVMVEREFLAGVIFQSWPITSKPPKKLAYTLRFPSELRITPEIDPATFNWRTNLLFPRLSGGGPRDNETNEGAPPSYFLEGFTPIQNAIARTFIRMKCVGAMFKSASVPNIQMQRYPYPPYIQDIILIAYQQSVALFIMLGFMYAIICTVRFIAIEKEKQLKEIMKIMGMPIWLHWTCWFLRTMILMIISISIMIGLLKIPMFDSYTAVLTNSNWFAFWIFLFVYTIAITNYCFFMSVLFDKANTAAAVSGLIWFISYIPYMFLTINYVEVPRAFRIFACFLPNVAMAYGCRAILDFEANGEGLQWSNFGGISTGDNDVTVDVTVYCMLGTAFLLLLIALYTEKVFPGEYGAPEPWYFPFTRKFWCDRKETHKDQIDYTRNNSSHSNDTTNKNFEPELSDCKPAIVVKDLRKVFDDDTLVVKNLTFNIFYDQITVLLGHNGAGKSTIFKMITGFISPTSGIVTIDGFDIKTDREKVNKLIGFCPQHNILFEELTVREHIEFFSRLKGVKRDAIPEEVDKYARMLGLEAKKDSLSSSLSGGMQRKLSFGIALCGDSKIVFCDEPTSGVDPASRRDLWDLMQSEKQGRAIILTTHFMDEADVLGDRIAIMADGELKCSGTPFFLKKRFGSGYNLICEKGKDCDSNEVTKMLHRYIPVIEFKEESETEIKYNLRNKDAKKFGRLFTRLEDNLEDLHLSSFSVNPTELEEVFLKMGSDTHYKNTVYDPTSDDLELSQNELLRGWKLRLNQWRAMCYMRFYSWIYAWNIILIQVFVLIFFTVISAVFVRLAKDFTHLPKLEISSETFGKNVVLLQTPRTNNIELQGFISEYRKLSNDAASLKEFPENIQEHILQFGDELRVRTNTRYLIGLSINENDTIIAWFNSQIFHTDPFALNLLHNAILRATLGSDHSIEVSNWPIPFRSTSRVFLAADGNDMGSKLATNITLAMAFTMALFVMFYIRERSSKAKLLLLISGVNVITFWLASFLFDFAVHLFISFILFLTILCFEEEAWSTVSEVIPMFLVLIIFGICTLAIVYVTSFAFSQPSFGFVSLTIAFVSTGISCVNLINTMSMPALDLSHVADGLEWVFLLFPHYALGYSFTNMHQFKIINEICRLQGKRMKKTVTIVNYIFEEKYVFSYLTRTGETALLTSDEAIELEINRTCGENIYGWEEPGIGRALVYMSVVGVVFFIILWIIEYGIFSSIKYYIVGLCVKVKTQHSPEETNDATDDAVQNEKKKVNEMKSEVLETYRLVLRNLTKYYGNFLAVNGICVAVQSGECFGLLGVNGAGKTSTFKMITGDTPISSGDVFVSGINLRTNKSHVHEMIGYCPQFDALLDDLTGLETLKIFGLIRGYRENSIVPLTYFLANILNFTKHLNNKVENYSGGNKRKLSTAIAIMGSPDVVYLDEPSSGMDPGARRNLWNAVNYVRKLGSSIVLTSHSMEECEAICTRLTIMVGGEFKCLGSAQHLKNQFSLGFLLTIKEAHVSSSNESVSETNRIRITNFVQEKFPESTLTEKYLGLLKFYVPKTNDIKWSSMFVSMETAKARLKFEDYSISQTTLEQVFLSFTKSYNEQASK